jgi:hypothetical protein
MWTQIPVCHNLCGNRSLLVTNYVDTDPGLSQTVWTQIPVCHKLWGHIYLFITNCVDTRLWQTGISVHSLWQTGSVSTQFVTNKVLCPQSFWQTGICVHIICDKQGSVSTQVVTNRDLSCVDTYPCLQKIMWTQIPVCHKLCGHRSLFVTNCVDTDPCLSQPVWTHIPACPHSLWQTGICVHIICDKQGSVSTQVVTNGSVSTQFVTNRDLCPCYKLCGHRSLFVTACEDTNPCLSQPVCVCGHRSLFFTNCVETDPCLLQIVWTQIPVLTNRDLCPHNL